MKRIMPLLIAFYLVGCHRNYRPAVKTGYEGGPIPSFSMLLSDSATRIATSDIPKGHATVLIFVSPVCPYCKAELGNILHDIKQLQNIQFYFITNFPFPIFKKFDSINRFIQYNNIVVAQDYKNFFQLHFAVTGTPFTVIYNEDKKMQKAFLGVVPTSQIKEVATQN